MINNPTSTSVVTSTNKPKSVLVHVLLPVNIFFSLFILQGAIMVAVDTENPPTLYFLGNAIIQFVSIVLLLAIPVGISYAIYTNAKNYEDTIKCGKCGYVGKGKKHRSLFIQVLLWSLSLFLWPVIIMYYLATHKYECPKCGSTFLGFRDKTGSYSTPYSGLSSLEVFLTIFLVILMFVLFIFLFAIAPSMPKW